MISRHQNTIDLDKQKRDSRLGLNNATEKLETREYYLFNCHRDVSIREERDFLGRETKAA
jgi:hypothetical protein